MQQPREQQIASFQQSDALGIHELALRQQPRNLHVQERRRHDQELRGLVKVMIRAERPHVSDELVGDLTERDLGDVELALADEAQQQIERAIEHVERDAEPTVCLGRRLRSGIRRARVLRRRRHGRRALARAAGRPALQHVRERTS